MRIAIMCRCPTLAVAATLLALQPLPSPGQGTSARHLSLALGYGSVETGGEDRAGPSVAISSWLGAQNWMRLQLSADVGTYGYVDSFACPSDTRCPRLLGYPAVASVGASLVVGDVSALRGRLFAAVGLTGVAGIGTATPFLWAGQRGQRVPRLVVAPELTGGVFITRRLYATIRSRSRHFASGEKFDMVGMNLGWWQR